MITYDWEEEGAYARLGNVFVGAGCTTNAPGDFVDPERHLSISLLEPPNVFALLNLSPAHLEQLGTILGELGFVPQLTRMRAGLRKLDDGLRESSAMLEHGQRGAMQPVDREQQSRNIVGALAVLDAIDREDETPR